MAKKDKEKQNRAQRDKIKKDKEKQDKEKKDKEIRAHTDLAIGEERERVKLVMKQARGPGNWPILLPDERTVEA